MVAQIDALVEALQTRRTDLINWVRRQRDAKVQALRAQVTEYTHTLQATTATIHFCIEALKESDPASFMEVGINCFLFLFLFFLSYCTCLHRCKMHAVVFSFALTDLKNVFVD